MNHLNFLQFSFTCFYFGDSVQHMKVIMYTTTYERKKTNSKILTGIGAWTIHFEKYRIGIGQDLVLQRLLDVILHLLPWVSFLEMTYLYLASKYTYFYHYSVEVLFESHLLACRF